MNNLLIFFAFPVAVIIISVIAQKLLKNPITVAALIFAIFLVVTFSAFDETFLIATFAYTVLAFITALIVKLICQENNNTNNVCDYLSNLLNNNLANNTNISNNTIEDVLSVNDNANSSDNNTSNMNNTCCCRNNRYRRF